MTTGRIREEYNIDTEQILNGLLLLRERRMHIDKSVYGNGLVKDDFTIEEHDLASFVYMNDAVNYIEMRVGGEISNQKIYYVDVRDEG